MRVSKERLAEAMQAFMDWKKSRIIEWTEKFAGSKDAGAVKGFLNANDYQSAAKILAVNGYAWAHYESQPFGIGFVRNGVNLATEAWDGGARLIAASVAMMEEKRDGRTEDQQGTPDSDAEPHG